MLIYAILPMLLAFYFKIYLMGVTVKIHSLLVGLKPRKADGPKAQRLTSILSDFDATKFFM